MIACRVSNSQVAAWLASWCQRSSSRQDWHHRWYAWWSTKITQAKQQGCTLHTQCPEPCSWLQGHTHVPDLSVPCCNCTYSNHHCQPTSATQLLCLCTPASTWQARGIISWQAVSTAMLRKPARLVCRRPGSSAPGPDNRPPAVPAAYCMPICCHLLFPVQAMSPVGCSTCVSL